MLRLGIGKLFRRFSTSFEKKDYEVFELVDYVCVMCFNSNVGRTFNVISGNYSGEYATCLSNSTKKIEYIFIEEDIDTAVKGNGNHVNFTDIKKSKIGGVKYCIRSDDYKRLVPIVDATFLSYLDGNKGNNKKSKFDENELNNEETGISSMYKSIKKTIVSQDEQIMKILTAIFKNQKVINSNFDLDLTAKLKENILVFGPTGTGKTEILKRIARIYKIPIVIEDATSLSEVGYVGRKVDDMLEDLCLAANNNIEIAEKGILVIDEFDKLAEKSEDGQTHVSRSGVQRSLLKLLDGTTFYFKDKHFDTSKLTVVALGAFTGIAKDEEYYDVTSEDFTNYGIMRELMGRFSKIIPMNSLKKEDIVKILLNSDFSPISTYKELFKLLEVEFEYNDDFIDYISDIALKKNSGARSIKTVFDECISSAMFRIFAGDYSKILLIKPDNENDVPYILTKKKKKNFKFL